MDLPRGAGVAREPLDIFFRRVLLLKKGDFQRNGDRIYMPTQSEMSALRARKGQYKRDVEFRANMSEAMVKKNLEETFSYLKDKRFFCAAKVNVDNNSSRFEFHGRPHLWNGRTIRRKIQGNSALYILEDDQSDTSGISGSEPETSPEELKLWLQQDYHSEVSIYPKESPLEGGALCRFTFIPKLQPDVTSGRATFENLGTVQLERLSNGDLLGNIPASPVPGLVTVTLYSQHGIYLGKTCIKYYGMEEVLKKIVFCPNLTKKIFEEYNKYYSLGGATKQTQHSGILGFTDPVQLLSLLVYTAAKVGAQQFLEMIFKTSSGRVVFDAYKSNLTLPEVIAKEHGHEVSARYLQDVTKRFSKEIKNGKECSKKIDWPELVKAAEEAEKRLNTTSEEDLKETAYLGDVDTSSESSQRQSSDSEEDISTTLRKASINDQQECDIRLQRVLHINDRQRGTKDQLNVEVHRKNNADEPQGRRGHERVVKKIVMNVSHVNISQVDGPVAVGPNSQITGATLCHPRAGPSGLSLTPSHGTFPLEADDAANNTETPEEAGPVYEVSEEPDSSESYLRIDRQQQYGKKGRKWMQREVNAEGSKGIFYYTGDANFKWTIETFLENPEKFIQDMDINAGPLKEEKEDFILYGVLPHLEESWGICSLSNEKTYEILARISFSEKSGKVVRQALQLLLYLISKDNFDSCNENLLQVEAVARSSFLSPEGSFKNDQNPERELKLYAYSRILSSLVIQQVQKGDLPIVTLEQDLKRLQKELKNFGKRVSNKEKNRIWYSIEFIQKAIPYLLKPPARLTGFLHECQEFCMKKENSSSELKILLERKKFAKLWVDLHCILIYLHGKVQSERHIQQIETERRAMTLLRLLVETHLKKGAGDDWKFSFLAATILSDIAINNATDEVRKEAGGCLVNLLKDLKVQKTPTCRAFVQRRSSETLFCPDKETRTSLVHFLSKNEHLHLELPADLHIKHLCSSTKLYRTQTLEINQTTISQSSSCFIKSGMFQRQKVAVKVLFVKKQHLLEENPTFHARDSLIREAHYLKLLNESRHPNIPVLLGYDTKSFPYHIITAFEKCGDLLQFVRKSRGSSSRLHLTHLRMLIDITDALLYLERSGLVHRAVMAANVLVGDCFVCKLSGMQYLRQLTNQDEGADSLYSYCSLDDISLEFISTSSDEELPVRWQAPECLMEHRYSTVSDVWGLGVLMYEVLTYGCVPYRHFLEDDEVLHSVTVEKDIISFESCFDDMEYELMTKCCAFQRTRRPTLSQVKAKLQEMHENADEVQARSDPPSLNNHFTYESSSLGSWEDEYSSISDIYEEGESHSVEEKQYTSCDIYDECMSQFSKDIAESLGNSEDLYSSITDIFQEGDSHSVEEGQHTSCDLYDEVLSDLSKEAVEILQRGCDYPLSRIDDHPTKQVIQGKTVVSEEISRKDDQHLKKLLALKHPNLAPIWKIDSLDSRGPTVEIISAEAPLGNLREYVFAQRCPIETIVTYLSQVASALHYLHVKHIVHGDLRAEYVNVIAPDKVQVGRLGRSKPLYMSAYEVTSTSCVVEAAMPPDSTRWSAPEVILEGHYTHASDVWAFGVLAWELYSSFSTGQEGREPSVPFSELQTTHQILTSIRDNEPPNKPEGCPDWVYIIMHQCWAYESVQRPPFLAIFDCLTSREPMRSWIMTLWLANHDQSEWPDLSICQSEDAGHVTETEVHPSKDVIEKMCSDEFFASHNYKYVEKTSGATRGEEDDSKAKKNLNSSPVYQDMMYMSVETHLTTTEAVGCNRRFHIESCQLDVGSKTANKNTVYSKLTKIKRRVLGYSNNKCTSEEVPLDGNDSMVTYDTPRVAYQNLAYEFAEGYSSKDEDAGLTFKHETCPEEEYNDVLVKEDTLAYLYQNAAHFTCGSSTGANQTDSDQLVPQSDHLYANMQKKVNVVTQDAVPQIGMETGKSHIEEDYEEWEALPHPKEKPCDSLGSDGTLELRCPDDSQLEFACYI